ncbi:hypothetical protein M8C21_017304 [Ambrosia artemisiifolia]|uniref:Glutaredoxin-like protein n=1 Tax=Ambrosia artemisiifolia TaxID=4212 RepID=A0AAD5CPK2_AMBAR|nr:hypothetical protein M8C21_017304 [Ambrosia artemisiifolia]
MAATAAAIVLPAAARRTSSASTIINISRKLNITFCNYSSSSSPSSRKQLILYSKPGCCLCDGLKEKLHSAFSLSSSNSLHDVDLQIRDITTNPDWEKAYQYEIPVLTTLRSDGTEEVIPRFSPRAGVDFIQSKLAAALSRDD